MRKFLAIFTSMFFVASLLLYSAAAVAIVSLTPMAGPLALIPKTCHVGQMYVATDSSLSNQLNICGGGNTWFVMMTLGSYQGLRLNKGVIDINPDVVPRLTVANNFLATQYMLNGISLDTHNDQPTCAAVTRGLMWYADNLGAKDGLQVCVYNGTSFGWISLY